jgi:hypothetical protein
MKDILKKIFCIHHFVEVCQSKNDKGYNIPLSGVAECRKCGKRKLIERDWMI